MTDGPSDPAATGGAGSPGRFGGWLDGAMVALGVVALGSAMGQFAITAVIGDVARQFGAPGAGADLSRQLGLTGTTIGIALALIRLASLASLPGAALADRFGRRRVLLATLAVGLSLTVGSALAPGFWWWVAIVAVARPWLSTTNAVAGVSAAEAVSSRHRTWALSFIAAAYAVGTGAVSIPRSFLPDGFQWVMLLAGLPLLAVPWLLRVVREPPIAARTHADPPGLPGAVPAAHVGALARLVAVTGSLAVATGPGFTYVFLFGEGILGLSPATMSVVVLLAGPVGLVGLLLGRWLADATGRRPAVTVGLVGSGVGFAAAYQGTPVLLLVGYLVGIMAGAAIGPGLGALSAELFPTTIRATVAGWLAAAGVVGAVIGLASFGALADLVGFGGAAVTLAVVPVVACAALLGLDETCGRELDAPT